jgi:hypothetical protein
MKSLTKIILATLVLAFFSTTAFGQHELYNSLNKRMGILYKSGKIMEAIATAQEVVKVAEETFGKNHAFYSASLENLELCMLQMGKRMAAELYEQSCGVREGWRKE